MTENKKPSPKKTEAEARKKRLSDALRENLKKRKAQAKKDK